MRLFNGGNVIGLDNRFGGSLGVSLYLGPAGTDDATQITYRRRRLLNQQNIIAIADPWPGGDNFLHDAIVAQATCPTTQVQYTLPAAYTSVTFWAQLRTFAGGVENPQIYRPEQITVDGSQENVDAIVGTGSVISVEKRDSGGMRVRFEYHAATTGIQPADFVLSQTAGPSSVDDETVSLSASPGYYTIDVSGLTDGGSYTFTLTARNGSTTKLLATINFTADADGGGAVQSLASSAC